MGHFRIMFLEGVTHAAYTLTKRESAERVGGRTVLRRYSVSIFRSKNAQICAFCQTKCSDLSLPAQISPQTSKMNRFVPNGKV